MKKKDTSQNDERIRDGSCKLTKDQQIFKGSASTYSWEFNDVWMSDLKDAYYGISTHFSLGGSK
jgi:hypothetical protein